MSKRLLLVAGVFISGLFLFYLTVLIVMPADLIERAITGSLKGGAGVRVESAPFKRALPFGVKAAGFTVLDSRGARRVTLDELIVRYSPLSPFTGRVAGTVEGTAGEGSLTGSVSVAPGGATLDVTAVKLPLSALGPLSGRGIDVTGAVSGRIELRKPYSGCPEGSVTARGHGLEAGGIKVLGFSLPFGSISSSGFELELSGEGGGGGGGCVARLKGMWLEGEGLAARLSGTIGLRAPVEASTLDLVLEVMPRGRTVDDFKNMVFLLPYRRSANYYSVKIRGTLGSPRM